jgi:beta-xylosidase
MRPLLPSRACATVGGASLLLLCGAAAPPPHDFGAHDFADPFVLHTGNTYVAFATGSGQTHVQAARSNDLAAWTPLGDVMPRLPAWAVPDAGLTWAPSVLPRADHFVLYYTARDRASGFQCISRATATSPQGPYVDESAQAFVCPVRGADALCGAIDPSPFLDTGGRPYLLWKSDENSSACHAPPRLWSARISDDGLAVEGDPVALLSSDRPWEGPIVEGPSMLVHDGSYYLFYSANEWETSHYAIGYATCAGPMGPCTKKTVDGPLRGSAGSMLGPGGQEFFEDNDGHTLVAYHAWTAPAATYRTGGARSLHIGRLSFDHDVPSIDDATNLVVATK